VTDLNGRLPTDWLVVIDAAGHQLRTDAAASYARARAAGLPAGGIRDAYRTLERQRAFYAAPPNSAGLAAVPGTSPHGWGTALDLDDPQVAWLAAHPDHGWTRTIAREPWHLEYAATADQHREDPDMDATQAKQLADTRTEVANIQRVAAKLDVALPTLVKAATTVPAAAVAGLSAADLDKIASAVADKLAGRLQG